MSGRRTSAPRWAWAVTAALLLTGCSSDTTGDSAGSAAGASSAAPTPAATAVPSPGGDPVGQDPGEDGVATDGEAMDGGVTDGGVTDGGVTDGEPTAVATDPPVEEPEDAGTPDDPADVDVVITYSGFEPGTDAVEVGGFAAVVEDDGECVLTLSRSGRDDVQVEAAATPDVRTTACGSLSVPADRLAPGEWTARLEYRSSTSSGTSPSQTVEIP